MAQLLVDLAISPDELLRLYRGQARVVQARALDGTRVKFPANCLRPFVTEQGVQGRFVLEFDAAYKLKGFSRLA